MSKNKEKVKKLSKRSARDRMRRVLMGNKQARLTCDQQQNELGNGNNKDLSIHTLTGYNAGCCSSISRPTSSFLKAYLCSKCLLWFHSSCISQLTSDDKEALRNNQWVCYDCNGQDQDIVEEQNEDELELDKKLFTEIEPQNKEKLMALKLIDELQSINQAIEMKLEEISKWVKNKFGSSLSADISEEIGTDDEQDFEFIDTSLLMEQRLSEISPIELNRIRIRSRIGDKRSEKSESTTKKRSQKIKERSLLGKHKKSKESGGLSIKKLNKGAKDSSNNTSPTPRVLKCPRENCVRRFGLETSLQAHINLFHDQMKNVICQFCGKSFGAKRNLRIHIRFVHEKKKRPDQNVICHYCGKSFPNNACARLHIESVHELGDKKFECPENNCSKVFTTKANLDKHIATHREPAEYLNCTEEGCLKRFKTKKSLKYHMEIHTANGVRNFACPMCDKTFMTRNCLAAHKRISHAKEVNHEFKCTFEGCNLGYSVRRYLEDHLKTHDPNYQPPAKQKLIICQYCAKEYETFPQLNRHILNVHKI